MQPDDVNHVIGVALAAYDELICAGISPELPPLAASADHQFVVAAREVIAALDTHFAGHSGSDRLAAWVARLDRLAASVGDRYDIEEAARLVELACRWAIAQLEQDDEPNASGPR